MKIATAAAIFNVFLTKHFNSCMYNNQFIHFRLLELLLKATKEVLHIIVDSQLLSKNDSFIVALHRLTIEDKLKIFVLRS